MKRVIHKEKGTEWCDAEIRLENGRLSVCRSYGEILTPKEARKQAFQYWESYFEGDREALGDMAIRFGTRTAKGAARKVVAVDGPYHGLDARDAGDKVYVTHGCGQVTDELREWFPGIEPLLEWHLNDMNAGTPEQRQCLKDREAERGDKGYHEWATDTLLAAGLLVVDASNFKTASGELAPKRYEYGSQWLNWPLPKEIEKLAEAFGAEAPASSQRRPTP
jgi:hypothetical protein